MTKQVDGNGLVQLTVDAHGGLERWRRFEHVAAHLRTDGVLSRRCDVRVGLRREWASHSPFIESNWRTSFEPHRVAIETTDGRIVEERAPDPLIATIALGEVEFT